MEEKEPKQDELFKEFDKANSISERPKMTLGVLQVISPLLNKILASSLPVKVSYRLSKTVDVLNKELTKVENYRVDLIKKHGNQDGDKVQVLPEKLQEFASEFQELLNLDADNIPVVPISLDVLEKAEVALSPIEMNTLIKMGFVEMPIEIN